MNEKKKKHQLLHKGVLKSPLTEQNIINFLDLCFYHVLEKFKWTKETSENCISVSHIFQLQYKEWVFTLFYREV